MKEPLSFTFKSSFSTEPFVTKRVDTLEEKFVLNAFA